MNLKHVPAGWSPFHLMRDFYISTNGRPATKFTTWGADWCAAILDEDLAVASVHDLLGRRFGLVITRVWQRLEAVSLNTAIAVELGVPPGVPALCMHQLLIASDRPVSYQIYHMRGDLYAFARYLLTARRATEG